MPSQERMSSRVGSEGEPLVRYSTEQPVSCIPVKCGGRVSAAPTFGTAA